MLTSISIIGTATSGEDSHSTIRPCSYCGSRTSEKTIQRTSSKLLTAITRWTIQ